MRLKGAVVAGSLAGMVLAVAPALSASADEQTRCSGMMDQETISGDLVVPKGKSCALDGTTVKGDVTVDQDADLITYQASVKGGAVVAENGYLDLTDTRVDRSVVSHGGYGVNLDSATLDAGYRGKAPDDDSVVPFLLVDDTPVAGGVRAAAGQVTIQNSDVAGSVSGQHTDYVDVDGSTIGGALAVAENTEGSFMCGSEVQGSVQYAGNDGLQLGGGTQLGDCDRTNTFGNDVDISDNTGGVEVNDNDVAGDLSGEGNDPAPTGKDNHVDGTTSGQFDDLGSTGQAQARSADATRHRVADTKAKAAQRTHAATKKAEAAGPAHL